MEVCSGTIPTRRFLRSSSWLMGSSMLEPVQVSTREIATAVQSVHCKPVPGQRTGVIKPLPVLRHSPSDHSKCMGNTSKALFAITGSHFEPYRPLGGSVVYLYSLCKESRDFIQG